MKFILLISLVLGAVTAKADITSIGGFTQNSTYVRVQDLGTSVKFEKCVYGHEDASCHQIGPRESYSKKSLWKREHVEGLQLAGAVAGDIAIVAGTVYIGAKVALGFGLLGLGGDLAVVGFGSGLAFENLLTSLMVYCGLGALTGVGATAISIMNPVTQYRQARVIRYAVVNDQDVKVKDMDNFLYHLESVLAKM
jgi:hypothetical protein